MRSTCIWVLVGGLLAFCASAQDGHRTELRGTLRSDSEVFYRGYVVEVSEMLQHQTWRADVMSDGTFLVRDLPSGDYLLRVMTYGGAVLKQDFVTVRTSPSLVEVRMPKQEGAPPGGPVSLRELQHPPAAKAVRAAVAAQRFSHQGDSGRAVEEFQKAIRISPDFAAAHSNLGVEYIRRKDFAAARREITAALEITGPNATDLCNLAFVDTVEQHYAKAVEEAKAALRADPSYANGHFILGTLLLLDNRTAGEGVRHLEQAAQTVPGARQVLAQYRR